MAIRVRIENLTKHYGKVVALDRVSVDVEPGEFFFLIGPSGCGKTTLLRAVAGFVEPDEGAIWFDEREMSGVPPYQRNTAMVFQGYALWPHMTVAQNVEYGLRVRGIGSAQRRRRVDEILETVRLQGLDQRYPNELSGGQQQRVALARALVVNPDLLLFDEPLSNLDARLRVEMRRELLRIHEQTGITAIYVTHDQKEALSMARRIAILDQGRVEQVGAPEDCYRRPRTRFVAKFLGDVNFVEGTVAAMQAGRRCEVETSIGRLIAAAPEAPVLSLGRKVTCGFRPESVRILKNGETDTTNRFRARVIQTLYFGDTIEYDFEAAPGVTIRAISIGATPPPAASESITLAVAPEDIVLL
jgi:iron(III) transport system ATP-binding protein